MKGVVFPACAIASWVATAMRARFLRQGWDPAVFTMCVCLGLSGLTFTVSSPAVAAGLERAVGIPNLAVFCIHVSGLALSFAIQVLVLTWAYDPAVARPKIKIRLAVLAAVVAVMAALFASTWHPTREAHYLVTGAENGGARFTAYVSFYLTALALGYGTSAWMSWQYAKVCRKPWLRRGVRISAVGLGLALGYVGTRAATLISARLGADPTAYEFLVPVFAGLSLLLTLVGILVPTWGPRFSAGRDQVRRYRELRRLEPLWRAFYDTVPGIALDPAENRRWRVPREVQLRLLRRVIEISDGRLTVAPYVPAWVAESARARAAAEGVRGAEVEDVVEAAQIAAGLAALARHDAPVRDAASGGPPDAGDDVPAEVDRLLRVTRAFTSSPVVAAFRNGTAPVPPPPVSPEPAVDLRGRSKA